MNSTRFSLDRLAVQAWKNGGGVTREIACFPAEAGACGFDWRASVATIATDGPFSVFEGVDRIAVLLDGEGMALHTTDGALSQRLDRAHTPHAFDGGLPLACTRLGGVTTVFNAMSRRGAGRADVRLVEAPSTLGSAAGGVLLALRGSWRAGDETLATGEGFWWGGTPAEWRLAPLQPHARLLAFCWTPA
jgi:environmental stress-induced protein Ves